LPCGKNDPRLQKKKEKSSSSVWGKRGRRELFEVSGWQACSDKIKEGDIRDGHYLLLSDDLETRRVGSLDGQTKEKNGGEEKKSHEGEMNEGFTVFKERGPSSSASLNSRGAAMWADWGEGVELYYHAIPRYHSLFLKRDACPNAREVQIKGIEKARKPENTKKLR